MLKSSNKRAGRPVDHFAPARAMIKELRGDAKRLETIAKKMRKQAEDLSNEIKVQKMTTGKRDDADFMDYQSKHLPAVIKIHRPTAEQVIENLFEDYK